MKIVIPTPIFPPEIGGPATYVYELAKRLSTEHEIIIITFTQDPQPVKNTNVVSISLHKHFLGILFRQLKLAIAIYKYGKNSDIIYAQGPVVVGFTSTIIGTALNKPTIIKFVGDIAWEEAERRGETELDLEAFLNKKKKSLSIKIILWFQQLILKKVRRIIVPSNYLKKILIRFYEIKADRIKVIHNAFQIAEIPKQRERKKQITIITAGRLVKHKRIDLTIQAFKFIKNKLEKGGKSKVRLLIIGEGPERKNLKSQISNYHLVDLVKIQSSLPKESYLEVLVAADLFVLASSYEGLPHAIIEAMALGTPVVASDIPGNREVIKHKKSGLLVKATSKELSKAMLNLLTDKKLAAKLKTHAAREAKARFNWDTHLKRLVHLFRQELAQ